MGFRRTFHKEPVLGKLCVYNLEDEEMMKVVAFPLYEESLKRILFVESHDKHLGYESAEENEFDYFIFCTEHLLGLSKYPIDGNPHTSLAMHSHSSGINTFVIDKEQNFIFTAGKKDSWIYMYEINFMAVLETEEKAGNGIDAFKCLFPINEDQEEMKKRLIYSVYSLELEMKLLQFGAVEEPNLVGEIPFDCLEYVLAALGCFVSPSILQLMLNDIKFENEYLYEGKKTTLSCLDIIKLYINYRPQELVTKEKISEVFRSILVSEGDADKISRAQFLNILSSRGDFLTSDELTTIIKCLKDTKPKLPSTAENIMFQNEKFPDSTLSIDSDETEININDLIPETITKEVLFCDILCMEKAEEDLSKYILGKRDVKLRQQPVKLDDFVAEIEKNNLWKYNAS